MTEVVYLSRETFKNEILSDKDVYDLPDKILRFPKINNIIPDYSLIRMSSTGKYSISRLEDSLLTTNEIINFYNNIILKNSDKNRDITITDATANAGGNTINFALNNLNVNSIELSTNEFYRLKNNIDLYKNFTKNVKVFNNDCLDLIYNKKIYQDIIYFDPPWGGPSYKNYKNLGLSLDNKDIVDHIDNLLENKYCSLIVLKGPYNTFIKNNKYLNYVIKFKLSIDKSSSKKYKDYYNLYFFSLIDQKKVTDYFNKLPLNKDEIINVNPYNQNKNETINRQIEYILEDNSLLNKNIVNKIYIIKSNIRGTETSINKILEEGSIDKNRDEKLTLKIKDNLIKNEFYSDIIYDDNLIHNIRNSETLDDLINILKEYFNIKNIDIICKNELYDLISDYIYVLNSIKCNKFNFEEQNNKIYKEDRILYIDNNLFNIFEYKKYINYKFIIIKNDSKDSINASSKTGSLYNKSSNMTIFKNILYSINSILDIKNQEVIIIDRKEDETDYLYNKRVEYINKEIDRKGIQYKDNIILESLIIKNKILYNSKY